MSEARDYVTLGELAELNAESLGTTTPKDRTFKYIDLSSVSHGSIDIASLEQFRSLTLQVERVEWFETATFCSGQSDLSSARTLESSATAS